MATLPSGRPEHVGDGEDLARFLTSSSSFNAVMVKPAAFLPKPGSNETSVFRHGAEPRESLWQLGQVHVGATRKLHGAAIIRADGVRAAGMDVLAQEPPPLHANITGWDVGTPDPEVEKARRREQAVVLASCAELIRP